MKIHSHTFDPFVPSRLLIESKRDAYEANGHEFLAAAEAQHQTKLRSRQIAASAVRYQKEHYPQGTGIAETDMVKIIEIISISLPRGTDHPAPFSDESLQDLHRLILSKKEITDSWEMGLIGSLQAAEQELSFENFLHYDHWLQELLYFLRRGRAGVALQGMESELADYVADRFLSFCQHDDGQEWDDQQKISTKLMLEEFLKHFIKLLNHPVDFELRFFLARFSAERLAVRHECSLQQWLFLFSNLEYALSQKIKKADAYHLSRYFLILQGMAPSLSFSGLVLREFPKLQAKLGDFQTRFEMDPKSLTQAALAEMLLDQSDVMTRGAPILPWAIIHGQSIFSKVSGTSFQGAQRVLCDAILQLAERNWIDLLSKPLDRMARSAVWRDQRRESAQNIDKITELTARNLAEGLDSLASNPRLVPDLIALLDQASLANLYFSNSRESLSYLRHWFIFNIGANQLEQGWQHGRTIVRSLKTNFLQSETTDPFQGVLVQGLENLNPIETWIHDCRICGTEAWPHATVHSLHLGKAIPEAKCQRDALWVLRRCLISTLHSGSRHAVTTTLRWITEEVVPFAGDQPLSLFSETYTKLGHAAANHEIFKKNQTADTMLNIAARVDHAVLSFKLWEQSDSLGHSAALKIYDSLPEYAEKSGSESLSLCARDNGMILKRTALGFRPEIEDQHDFIGFWWHNVVSLYLATRHPRLFQTQVRELSAVVEQSMGSPGGALIRDVLDPVISGALTENMGDVPTNRVYRFLPARPLLDSKLVLPQTEEHPSSQRFRSWLPSKLSAALTYAQQHPLVEAKDNSGITATELEKTLSHGLPYFLTYGDLSSQTTASAYRLCGNTAYTLAFFERSCNSLNYELAHVKQTADVTVWLSYLGAWIAWSRRARAALWLGENAHSLAENAVNHVHRVVPSAAEQGVSSASLEKCSRDFSLLLVNLAVLWKTETPQASLLHSHRYVLQVIAPYVGYGDQLWRLIWQAAAMNVDESLDVGARRFALDQLAAMEKCATHFDILQPIAQRINGALDPVFSPEEESEGRWRDSVNLILALAALDPSNDDLRRAYTQAAVSSCPLPLGEFGDRLDSVLAAFGEWFVEADLSSLRRAVTSLRSELLSRKLLSTVWDDLPTLAEKLKGVLQIPTLAESNQLMLGLTLNGLKLQSTLPTGWSVPAFAGALAALPQASLDLVVTQPERLERAILNLLGSRLGADDAASEAAKNFISWATGLREMGGNWQMIDALKSGKEHGELCLRDTQWLARRLVIASIHGAVDLENALSWYSSEILDYAKEKDFKKIQTLVNYAAFEINNQVAASTNWKSSSTSFSLALPRLLLARRLNSVTALSWSDEAVDRALLEKPGISANPEKCKRDTALALNALSRSLEPGLHASSAMEWWKKSVQPFLTSETMDSAAIIHRHVVNLAKPQLSEQEQTLLQEALAPFLALKS